MLLVQEYLETHSFADLAKDHGVYASFSKSGHKWSLNYDQIEAKEADPLAQECRGLILACEDGRVLRPEVNGLQLPADNVIPGKTKILAYPMKRFFNHGQGSAADINWSDPYLAVMEKLDGTLCIVYYDSFIDKWCVATRAVPEADLIMDNGIFTFRTLFEKAFKETTNISFDDFSKKLDKDFTYCFELTTPYNRIVVYYPQCKITLLAVRSMLTYYEVDIKSQILQGCLDGVPLVHMYTFTSVNELVDWVSTLNPMEHEGVVVRDSHFNRIKVKNALYVAYNKARDVLGTSERNCLEIILAEKDDDVIPFLPEEIVNNLIKIKDQLQIIIKEHDKSYLEIKSEADAKNLGDKKTFAILLMEKAKEKNLWTAPFFQMFAGKTVNMKDFIQQNKKDGTWSNSFLDKLLEMCKK